MSVHVSSRVWRLDLPSNLKLVLLKLADCADDKGHNAFPSVAHIGRECGMSPRNVQRVLRQLEALGAIELDREASRYSPKTYSVVTTGKQVGDNLSQSEDSMGDNLSSLSPGSGATSATSGVTPRVVRDDASVTRSVIDPSMILPPLPSRARARFSRVFGYEPTPAQEEELEGVMDEAVHPAACFEWVMHELGGKERPGIGLMRSIFAQCLTEGHGPRERRNGRGAAVGRDTQARSGGVHAGAGRKQPAAAGRRGGDW